MRARWGRGGDGFSSSTRPALGSRPGLRSAGGAGITGWKRAPRGTLRSPPPRGARSHVTPAGGGRAVPETGPPAGRWAGQPVPPPGPGRSAPHLLARPPGGPEAGPAPVARGCGAPAAMATGRVRRRAGRKGRGARCRAAPCGAEGPRFRTCAVGRLPLSFLRTCAGPGACSCRGGRAWPVSPLGPMAEEALFRSEHPVSASEDEGDGDEEKRHQQLLEAVSSLAGRKRRKLAERSEASVQVSEFNLSCEGAGERLVLPELLGSIRASSSLSTVKKQLNRVKQKKSVELPLSKEESERVVREAAYSKTSKAVAKWEQVVLQNRRAEQLVFPLKQERGGAAPIEEVLTGWKARTPLEQEIFSLLHKTQQPVTDPLLTPLEEASLRAMSLEEAQLRRAELQKARALQSYYEAKARRAKKIKSKKYHRVLQKGRSRKALKEFEELRKLDPEAALGKLEEMERKRMEERMSLKHQNKGKWARSKAIMAKYDLEARKAMQEQLARNKELTHKVPLEPEGEEEGAVAEEGLLPDSVNDVQPSTEGANPWMLGKPSSEAKGSGTQEDPGEDPGEPAAPEEAGKEEEEVSEEELLLQEFEQRRCARRRQAGSPGPGGAGEAEEARSCVELPAKVQTGPGGDLPAQEPEGPLLSEQLDRRRTLEEIEALGQEEGAEEQERPWPPGTLQESQEEGSPGGGHTGGKATKEKRLISLQAVLAGESRAIQCPALPVSVLDEEEEAADQRLVIQEAFAGDDVAADFLREKRKAEQAGKPQAVNLVLPGWGEWGGRGLRPSARKRKRFLIKPAPGPPRRDQHLPHVIISQQRNTLAAAHQVNELPFPFDRRQQFEQSVRAPVGPTWNTQRAFQKLTAPRILTQPGHIIQPISAEDASPQRAMPVRGGSAALPATPQRSRRHQRPRKAAR